jgi:glucuronoxylan 4-O-methyltransferase
VFLESNGKWIAKVGPLPGAEIHRVTYTAKRSEWRRYLAEPGALRMDIPDSVRDTHFHVILVDAPMGNTDKTPGRMQSIYLAASLVHSRKGITHVFVHDINRAIEWCYSDRYLGKPHTAKQLDRLRHYTFGAR